MYENQPFPLEEIKTQLTKILESEAFRESEKLKNFLRFAVKETLEGRGNHLKQYTIAVNAFDRGIEFDPQKDPIVRIQAGRLRQHLGRYYRTEGKNDTLLIEIPKGSYIPEFSNMEKFSGNYIYKEKPSSNAPTIAVFPFKNLSGIESNQYIADGFTEELIMTLSLFKHFIIIRASRKRVNYFEEQNIGRNPNNARFILDGSVRFKDSRIKVVVTLTDANNNEVIWGNEFFETYELEKVIDIQETVAQNVAGSIADIYGGVLVKKLFSETRKRTYKNIERYDAILYFYHYERNPIASEYDKVIHLLNEIVRKYPDFGAGWAALSILTVDNYSLGFADEPGLLNQAIDYAKKGVHFDPDNQMTRAFLGYAYLINNQLEDSILQLKYAKSLNPRSAYFIGAIGWASALAGEWEEGMADIELSYFLNPDYPKWYHLATVFYFLKKGKFERALKESLKFDLPDLFWDPLLKAVTFAHLGKQKDAKKSLEDLLQINPDFIKKPSFYLGMFIKFEDIRQLVLEGLEKAGLSLKLLQ
jgi:adenylate cyclase